MSKLNVYAWSKPGVSNFGDELGPDILHRIGHTITRVPAEKAEVTVCGSVLEKLVTAPRGCVVAGAGSMHGGNKRLPNPKHLDIRALRGLLTWSALNESTKADVPAVPFGDPGILAPVVYDLAPRQAQRLGVVPHYIDSRAFPYADVVINVQSPPQEVIYEISKCSRIMSSSLHGLIVAESLGIPAMRLPYHKVIGGDAKWVDYYTGVDGDKLIQKASGLYKVLEEL